MVKQIYVVGYPKSGNTWLTKLISDALDCSVSYTSIIPVKDYSKIHKDTYRSCLLFKSHISRYNGVPDPNKNIKIIYIMRDFRDVLVSSFFHHYRIDERLVVMKYHGSLFMAIRRIYWKNIVFSIELHKLVRYWGSISGGTSFPQFLKGIIGGRWLKDLRGSDVGSWSNHIDYWANCSMVGVVICYEDLLKNTYGTLTRTLKELGIQYQDSKIKMAVEENLFEKKKEYYEERGEHAKANFMRKGKQGDWARFINRRMIKLIKKLHGPIMNNYGYHI